PTARALGAISAEDPSSTEPTVPEGARLLVVVREARVSSSPLGCLPLPLFCESPRSEEHTSELQSRFDLVCRLLLEKKKETKTYGGGEYVYNSVKGDSVHGPERTHMRMLRIYRWVKVSGGRVYTRLKRVGGDCSAYD